MLYIKVHLMYYRRSKSFAREVQSDDAEVRARRGLAVVRDTLDDSGVLLSDELEKPW
jgi:hypothetical protein